MYNNYVKHFEQIKIYFVLFILRAVLKSIQVVGYVWVYDNLRITELPWDSAWTWWLAFMLVDLGYYWFHRMAHGKMINKLVC